MNIGIDVNALVFSDSGIGRYSAKLLEQLLYLDKNNHYFLYASFIRKKAERQAKIEAIINRTKAKNVSLRILPLPAAWLELYSRTPFKYQNIIKDELDLYFAPHFSAAAKNGFPKTVVTIFDLVFLRFPAHRGKKLSNYYLKRTKIAIKNAQKIIAISRATSEDLQNLLNVDQEKIKVIPLGVSEDFKKINGRREIIAHTAKYIKKNLKYILSVGTLEPRKNLNRLLLAYSLLPYKLKQEYKLLLVGPKGWNNSELEEIITDNNLKHNVIIAGFVEDADLPYIYNRASVFVYPSLYEGFGLPPLEAMSCGVAVITSNNSSLPEVVNNAAILINPLDEKEIAESIEEVLTKPKLRQELIKRGQSQAKKFSWRKTARETLKVFEEVGKIK